MIQLAWGRHSILTVERWSRRRHRPKTLLSSGPAWSVSVLLYSLLTVSVAAQGRPPIGKNPQAVVALQQALSSLGDQTLPGVHDLTATGTITYSWAGKQVPGTVQIKVRGSTEFRMDSATSYGSRSLSIIGHSGQTKREDGKIDALRYSEATNGGILTFPNWLASAALTNPLINLSYEGTTLVNGMGAVAVQLTRFLPSQTDTNGKLSALMTSTLFIDSKTGLILKAQHFSYQGKGGAVQPFKVETYFSDYRVTGGVALPFSIALIVEGQQIWAIQLNKIELNSGLTDADFKF